MLTVNCRALSALLTGLLMATAVASLPPASAADKHSLDTFERKPLTTEYYSEGANGGDLNNDGHGDAVYGPHWYEGPDFTTKHEIYAPRPQNRDGYSDHFFAWIYDFDGDGWKDVFTVGFPGTPAYVYQNPGAGAFDKHWQKHQVFDSVANESPQLINLTGDERPELVCTRGGFFGFATIDWEKPLEAWKFHQISEKVTADRFGHGLGIGDVNGDGRLDIIHAKGWYEQPAEAATTSRWPSHDADFTNAYGGAEMYAYDVDGDGDNDVITSLAAHDFGLSWFEQVQQDGEIAFKPHLIMGSHAAENRYGLVFSELHSVALADIDGDGLQDIVTGKTYYSHHKGSPMWDAGAVIYWFRLVRGPDGVDWVPYRIDDVAGVGRQISVVDLNKDNLPDIVVGGMVGGHVLLHRRTEVDKATWDAAQPKRYQGPPAPSAEGARALRGPKVTPDETTGEVAGVLEGESLKTKTSSGNVGTQAMTGFTGDKWSGGKQLFWTGGRPGDTLKVMLPEQAGPAELDVVLTCARDYGIVQLALDGQPLGKPIDLYDPQVVTTGVLTFSKLALKPGPHVLSLQIVGANAKAAKSYLVGIDYVRLRAEQARR